MTNDIINEEIQVPNFISNTCSDLLFGLLCKDPDKRLGSK